MNTATYIAIAPSCTSTVSDITGNGPRLTMIIARRVKAAPAGYTPLGSAVPALVLRAQNATQ
eukprot:4829322-Amphidinium_carterae.1